MSCPADRAQSSRAGSPSLVPPPPSSADRVELELQLLSMLQASRCARCPLLPSTAEGGMLHLCSAKGWAPRPTAACAQQWLHFVLLVSRTWHPRRHAAKGADFEALRGEQVRDMTGNGEVTKRRVREGVGEFPVDCPLEDCAVRVHYTARIAGTDTVRLGWLSCAAHALEASRRPSSQVTLTRALLRRSLIVHSRGKACG